jgi:predicted kinase
MTTFIMMVGLVGSGKSTRAQKLAEEYDANIHSSDAIREELSGDINNQDINDLVFNTLHNRIKEDLRNGKNCIYDATNINYKKRMAFLQELKNIPCEKICVLMATPYEACLKNNAARERYVPEDVIKRMYMNFHTPWYIEGWNDIRIEYAPGSENYLGDPIEWVKSVMGFNQDNPHHTLTLGSHCLKAGYYIGSVDNARRTENVFPIYFAGLLHDEGKIFTKTFIDSKGNPSETAHYYQHHCCSAYDSLFFDYPANHLYVATLIGWHMQLHFIKEEKTLKKYKKLWGEELYNDLSLLHEADVNAR